MLSAKCKGGFFKQPSEAGLQPITLHSGTAPNAADACA